MGECDKAGAAKNICLAILGSFSLRDHAGQEIVVRSRKNRALLAILALSTNRTTTRERVATLLWGDHGDKQARASLRQSLAVLHRELGPVGEALVRPRDEMLSLPRQDIEIDALEVLACANTTDIATLRRAAEYCRGELLADVSLRGEPFQDWLEAERSRLRAAAIRLFEHLVQEETGPARIEAARRLLQLDDLRESTHRALMRAYAEAGDNGSALKQYEHCKALIRDQLAAEPAQETKDLRREITKGAIGLREAAPHLKATVIPPALPDRPSIAVLPFQNMSGDSEQDYFADGVVEEIIIALSRLRWLFVIARNSSFTYKGRAVDVKQIGRELGVRYVLEGSVRKAGSRLRITGQLIDATTGVHLWADRFNGGLADVFDLQDQVTASVVGAISPKLEQAEAERAKRKTTESLDAYDYYLRGMASAVAYTREGYDEALLLFYKAIELDPDFAAAYGMAAWCFVTRKSNGWMADRVREAAEGARLARQAVKDSEDAIALSWGGFALAYLDRDLDGGISYVERALGFNPNLAAAWYMSGWLRVYSGEPKAATQRLEHALRLSPLDPLIFRVNAGMAYAHFFAGRYDEATVWAEKALRERPTWLTTVRIAAASHARAGRLDKARTLMTKMRELDPVLRISNLNDLLPLRRPHDYARWADALRKAGLPE